MNLNTFTFDGEPVRTVTLENGEPGFVGRDVAERLGYADTSDAIKRHCKGPVIRRPLLTPGGQQEVRVLAEADVLRLIVSSKLPAAERFERWVFEDVLPALRRTGRFEVASAEPKPAVAMEGALLALLDRLTAGTVEARQQIAQVQAGVQAVASDNARLNERLRDVELREQVLDVPPVGYLSLNKIRALIGERHGLSSRTIDAVVDYAVDRRRLVYVLVRNAHEDANGRTYRAFRQSAVSEMFRQFEAGIELVGGRTYRHPWLTFTFFVSRQQVA